MHIYFRVLLIGITLIACLSPLLTFANLWQIKEWRVDRLREHLRAEGMLRQLYGRVRPVIILCGLGFLFVPGISREITLVGTLALLGVLTLIQKVLKKQSEPVWTQKACAVVFLTLLLDTLLIVVLMERVPLLLPLIILFQPDVASLVWLLLWPVDRVLKQRTMTKAIHIRSNLKNAHVIGITGSAGKTTTKELLAHVLDEKNPFVTPAHVNSEMGVSKWLQSKVNTLEEDALLIVEMGAYRKGEIKQLCKIAQPTMGVLTLIGSQHIALFGSQEELCDAKGELLEALPDDGQGFVNADNDFCVKIAEKASCPVMRVGTGGSAELEATDIEERGTGIHFKIGDVSFDVPLHGTHNVTNVLLTIAVAEHLGMSRNAIAQKLQSFQPPNRTFTVREVKGVTVLDDTHNASIASFRAAIAWARNQPLEHKTLLTPGLIELGPKQDQVHTELGTLAQRVFDRVVFLHEKNANAFAKGFGEVEILRKNSAPVQEGSLLVCEGRMTDATMHRLLP